MNFSKRLMITQLSHPELAAGTAAAGCGRQQQHTPSPQGLPSLFCVEFPGQYPINLHAAIYRALGETT